LYYRDDQKKKNGGKQQLILLFYVMMNVFYLSKKLFACGVVLFLLLIPGIRVSHAQSTNKFIRKGNKLYEKQQFTDAEAEYKKALSKDSVSAAGLFNLGNSLYQQKRYGEALEQYAASAKTQQAGWISLQPAIIWEMH
jgi:tetratricopeptide (TPR) repeat protein